MTVRIPPDRAWLEADNSKKRKVTEPVPILLMERGIGSDRIWTGLVRIGSARTTFGRSVRQGDVTLTLLAVITTEPGSLPGMSTGENRRPADEAIHDFIRHLANRDFSITTRRIRRHFLDEYLQHVQRAADTADISAGELMEPARAAAWLADAANGKTRSRNTLGGPDAAAFSNSMRVRIDTYNAFAEFLCLPDRYDRQPPAAGDYLTPADTERLLHDLAVRRPIHANAATAIRTAAVAALVADTGRNVPELARLNVSALHLEGEARVDLSRGFLPAQRRDRADPDPVARRPGGDRRRARGQRPWLPVDPDQARAAARRTAARQTRPLARGGPHPPRRPSNPRQPGTREAASSWRLPRCQPITFSVGRGFLKIAPQDAQQLPDLAEVVWGPRLSPAKHYRPITPRRPERPDRAGRIQK